MEMNHRPPSIPFSIISELRCRNCQNFVSCGPVYVLPDESILCGRCKLFAKDIFRNYSFEALASIFLYPCIYWNGRCPRVLHWNECTDHEGRCSYKDGCNRFWNHPKAFLKGKREMPIGDIRLIPVPEKLLDYIKCIQCESYLSCEPVYIRSDGKNICHRCIHSNGIPEDSIRNTTYETLSTIIIFPCIFRNRGCPTRLKFGTDLWHHEAECSYNQMFKKQLNQKDPSRKEKGVIQTITGHIYGTLGPYTAPFAPTSNNNEFDINKKLLQSLKKQQERKVARAEEISSAITKMSSDTSSELTSEKGNSFDKNSYIDFDSPSITRSDDAIDYIKSTASQPSSSPDPKQMNPVFVNSPKDFLQFNFNVQEIDGYNYYQNIRLAQVHNDNDNTSIITGRYEEQYDNARIISRNNATNQNDDESALRSPSVLKTPLQELTYNPLEGQYPVYMNSYGQGLIPKPTVKGIVRTDSLSSNRELIQELRIKQSQMRKSVNEKKADSPYTECNNLEDVLQVHDKIGA